MTHDDYIKRRNELLTTFLSNTVSPAIFHSEGAKYHKAQAQQAIDGLVLAVIGEDEPHPIDGISSNARQNQINQQRSIVKELEK